METKKTILIDMIDCWGDLDKSDNVIYNTLSKHYNVVFSKNPEFLFYSCGDVRYKHKRYEKCIKICISLESYYPNFNESDYSLTLNKVDVGRRNFRVSYMNFTARDGQANTSSELSKLAKTKVGKEMLERKFCNFVYSQDRIGSVAKLRKEFCQKLSQYKHVDCPGRVLNNIDNAISVRDGRTWQASKIEFLRNYKFTIAFENQYVEGYWTEKLTDAFFARSIPIYFGDPLIGEIFNTKAFINGHEYGGDMDKIIERVKEIDSNDELYMEILNANPILPNAYYLTEKENLERYLCNIIENGHIWDKHAGWKQESFIKKMIKKMLFIK